MDNKTKGRKPNDEAKGGSEPRPEEGELQARSEAKLAQMARRKPETRKHSKDG
jgi:hypothetical protein